MSRQRLFHSILIVFALATLIPAVLPDAAGAADVKPLAVIDSARIVEEYSAAKDAQEQFQRFLQELEREIGQKEKDLLRMSEEIESQKLLLGEDALNARVEEFQRQREAYDDFRNSADSRAESEYKSLIQPIINQVKTIAERLGREEGFGLIIDVAALTALYIDPDVDLTDKVLGELVRGAEE